MNSHLKIQIKAILDQVEQRRLSKEEALARIKSLRDAEANPSSATQLLYFQELWQSVPPNTTSVLKEVDWDDSLLLLNARPEIAAELCRKSGKSTVIRVSFAPGFERSDRFTFSIRPDRKEDYEQLVATLTSEGSLPTRILHIGAERLFEVELSTVADQIQGGPQSAILLCQAFLAVRKKESLRYVYLYEASEERHEPVHRAVAGLFKEIGLEHALFSGRVCSLASLTSQAVVDATANFWNEAPSSIESNFTNGQFKTLKIDQVQLQRGDLPILRERGVCLITGGAGGLGFHFAEYLATKVRARLVLMARSVLSEAAKSRIQALESLGAEVCYVRGDVGNLADVESTVAEAKRTFGTINAVIHAAGIMPYGRVADITLDALQSVWRPKIQGTIHLDLATRNESLDWMAFFSSISSVIGVAEACGYASGNAFMDHFAAWRTQESVAGRRSGRTISFNWPLWKEGGMQVGEQASRAWTDWMWSSQGMRPLTKAQGFQAFEAGLQSGESRIIVAEGDPERIPETLRKGLGWRAPARISKGNGSKNSKPVLASVRQGISRDGLLSIMMGHVSDLLSVPEADIDLRAGLSEFGFDSISLKAFAERLNYQFQLDLMPSIFFTHSSLNALADHLVATYGDKLNSIQTEHSQPEPVAQIDIKASDEEVEDDPIAIVGMSGMLPGSSDLDAFWDHLEKGHDLITEIPASRWDANTAYQNGEAGQGKTNSKWGGFIGNVEGFDAEFFRIPPWEAERMDPQHRLFLETAWKCVESAGESPEALSGRPVGVFVGIQFHEYQDLLAFDGDLHMYNATGNGHAMIANRLSYFLNLRGPSEAVDTACSSSLVALNRAVSAMRGGECESAIVGGVSLILSPGTLVVTSQMGILSSDGRCKVFDASANGYVKGEGVLALYLMPLSKAKRGRHPIHGLIRGIGVNHGGKASSLTAPNAQAQSELIVQTYRRSGVAPESVSYIEAHGTGTELGDPVEIEGLKSAFSTLAGKSEWAKPICGIGSVKSNIGHLEPAAGLAGVAKVLLAMKHRALPASLHVKQLNPYLKLDRSPFYIVQRRQTWESVKDHQGNAFPRRAGVSSFGFGGANAHVVLEEYLAKEEPRNDIETNKDVAVVLSAKSETALRQRIVDLHQWLASRQDETSFRNLVYTLQVGRTHFVHRCAFTAKDLSTLKHNLSQIIAGERPANVRFGKASERSNQTIQAIQENALTLCEAYVRGDLIDWATLYQGTDIHRLSLPGYPFVKTEYWYRKREKSSNVVTVSKERSSSVEKARLKLKTLGNGEARESGNLAAPPVKLAPILNPSRTASTISQKPAERSVSRARHSDQIVREIKGIVAAALYLETEGLDEEKTFTELGSDSILGVQIIRKINEAFELNVPASKLYDHPNIKRLAGHIADLASQNSSKNTDSTTAASVQPIHEAKLGIAAVPSIDSLTEIKSIVAAALYLDSETVDTAKPFAELGSDSILGVEIIRRINTAFQLNIPASALYEHSSIAAMARYIERLGGSPSPVAEQFEGPKSPVAQQPGKSIDHPRVLISRSGNIDDLTVANSTVSEPRDHEIQVEVRATSVILPDLLCLRGLYPTMPPYPFTPGFEFSGVVTRVGRSVTLHRVGDAVFGVTGETLGGHAASLNVGEELVVKLPRTLSFAEATTIPEAYLTAYFALLELGRLVEGERVLIHSAASGTGLAAIQLAQWKKAEIFASVGSDEKVDYLRSLGVQHVVNYRTGDFQKFARETIGPRGVDVVLNMLTGVPREEAVRAMAPFGRFLDLAVAGLRSSGRTDLSSMVANQIYYSVDCRQIQRQDSTRIPRILNRLVEMVNSGLIKPLPINRVFDFNQAREAYALVQDRVGIGKVLLCRGGQINEPVVFHPKGPALEKSSVIKAPMSQDIAVVGMACRFPGAQNLEQFWDLLTQGQCAVREIPSERWSIDQYFDPDPQRPGKTYSKWGGFLDGIDQFDPLFFNISPAEAEQMDPQQRLFLETAWHALEDAGCTTERLSGAKCGVFVGVGQGDYVEAVRQSGGDLSAQLLMGSSCSMVGARLAYFLNLMGPSVAVDTACSSSLVAIYHGCQSLLQGDSELALAGGICVMTTPAMYIMMSKAGMLSPTGLCRTFDQSANGFVPGEGGGLVVLKRLDHAVQDGDRIYGVIKAAGSNQDGATNGITAPNPASQKSLEIDVYRRAGIHPESVGYVEAHGTGTKLGDPIEIDALTEAFRESTTQKQFCAIGSVKTNIGHTLSAAGAASVIKTLLCLYHKKLVPSLHYDRTNEHIALDASPFYVNTVFRDWPQSEHAPRRAAVSSFGFSGTNVHMVLEEASAQRQSMMAGKPGYLIALSARTEENLRQKIEDLIQWLNRKQDVHSLENIAYTLNAARSHFKKRCFIVVGSLPELRQKLESVRLGETVKLDETTRTSRQQKANELTTALFRSNPSPDSYREMLNELGELYLQGISLDWERLHFNESKERIALPGYPFKKKRYWASPNSNTAQAHEQPRLSSDRNTAGTGALSVSKILSQNDWFIRDHLVRGVPTVPGVAYLEMVRTAGILPGFGKAIHRFRNVVFAQPLRFEKESFEVEIRVTPQSQESCSFTIGSKSLQGEAEVIHAQGVVSAEVLKEAPERFPIQSLESHAVRRFAKDEIYQYFHGIGLQYGPGFRSLSWIALNEGEALGKLELSEGSLSENHYLHPGLLDGALQTIVGWSMSNPQNMPFALPFEIKEITFYRPLTKLCYAFVRRGASNAAQGIYRYDARILDADGTVLCRIDGFALKALENAVTRAKQVQHFLPVWIQAEVSLQSVRITEPLLAFDNDDRRVQMLRRLRQNVIQIKVGTSFSVLAHGTYQVRPGSVNDLKILISTLIECGSPVADVLQLWPLDSSYDGTDWLLEGIRTDFALAQAAIEHHVSELRVVHVHRHIFGGMIAGYAKSLQQEHPRYRYTVLDIGAEEGESLAAALVKELNGEIRGDEIKLMPKGRLIKQFQPQASVATSISALPKNRVYLITGGLGGLGKLFAEHLIRTTDARVMLVGRSAATPEQRQWISLFNGKVVYERADISILNEAQRVVALTEKQFGAFHGIIHAAGILRDSRLIKKSSEDVDAVLSPKIQGTLNLDEATRHLALDCFTLFSSIAGALGNVGQCDYAAANAFLDRFALWREELRQKGNRHGWTISINWPWWCDGGMRLDGATQNWMRTTWGLEGLGTEDGLEAFNTIINRIHPQTMVLCGDERRWAEIAAREPKSIENHSNRPLAGGSVNLRNAIMRLMAEQLKVEEGEIDQDEDLSIYGFDSISLTEFSNRLNRAYNLETTPALFFEYPTISSLSEYLISNYPNRFQQQEAAIPKPSVNEIQIQSDAVVVSRHQKPEPSVRYRTNEPIAVIGMQGRFPGAPDLDAFWSILESAKDCISEVPVERWDWRKLPAELQHARWGGFMDGIDLFDAGLFGISRREAELMDPQQRLFLETVWALLENAGYPSSPQTPLSVGLFVGVSTNDYAELLSGDVVTEAHSSTGLSHSILVNRVSYLLNLIGPSEAVNTACSSSLVALHRAVRSLRDKECETAVAAGVSAIITPTTTLGFLRAGMLSRDGRCKTFDERADGYVRGEGIGAVMLKRLEDAKRDGDHIYGVILGSAVNHGGRTNTLTAPNPTAQAEVVLAACRDAEIEPETLSYVEAHGTGTALGDPIEINGLKRAFASNHAENDEKICGLGTVKTNIGHLEASAGIAGVLKVLLSLQNKKLPASLHLQKVNSYVRLEGSPFYIVRETMPWKELRETTGTAVPRRAGVSSFGFGGANAHVVLEEAPTLSYPNDLLNSKPWYLVTLSAKNQKALEARIRDLVVWLQQGDSSYRLEDISFTLNAGRHQLARRCALLVRSRDELLESLQQLAQGGEVQNAMLGDRTPIKPEDDAVFKAVWEAAADALRKLRVDSKTYREKLWTLAGLYIKGYALDWNSLHEGETRRRIPMPTYPFQRESYWVPRAEARPVEQRPQISSREVESSVASPDELSLSERLVRLLVQEAGQLLKVDEGNIDPKENLSEFGFDSFNLKALADRLNARLGLSLLPNIFFTYPSLNEIAEHLCESFQDSIVSHFSLPKTERRIAALATPKTRDGSAEAKTMAEPIAVVGMSGIFPGSPDLRAFWKNLVEERDLVSEVPASRWDWQMCYGDALRSPGKTNSKWGGFIEDVDCFDADFFGISPREAGLMDPQQRIFLQTAWHAIESAGEAPDRLSGKPVGVFVGIQFNDYQELLAIHGISDPYNGTGNAHSIVANRISYLLNLTGPSETIDTACSSSLVALNRAVQSLRLGECDAALAGGVNLMLSPGAFIATSQLGALSPDGRCKTFDAGANGYVRGEGAGALYLMRLSDAEQGHYPILGVIKGSVVNHGGKAQSMTAPNARAQADLLVRAYQQANLAPDTISYIEAHGTGTELGDPVEVEGLKSAFAALAGINKGQSSKVHFCGLGSVKSNIGHLEPAAGIAGVIKVLLAMRHGTLPASLHIQNLNPYIQIEGSPFFVVDRSMPWERLASGSGLPIPRRAGVSSFGFGGTNAHVVLEEHSGQNSVLSQSDDLDCLFAISARTPEALRRRVEDLLQWIKEDGAGYSLADISYTLNVGRTHHDCRAVAIAGTIDELLKELGLLLRGKKFHGRAGKDARAGTVDKRKVVEAMAAVQQKRLSANGVYRESLVTLGELYLGGAAVEWRSLYDASHSRRRIELPVYPFSKKRFWLPTKPEIRTLSQVDDVILRGGKMSFDDLLSKRLLTDLEEDKISVEDVINELKQ